MNLIAWFKGLDRNTQRNLLVVPLGLFHLGWVFGLLFLISYWVQ